MLPLRTSLIPLLLLTVAMLSACSSDDCFTCFELGSINVSVRDQSGAPVDGVVVEVSTKGGELQATDTTPSFVHEPGGAWFLLVAGRDYRVRVRPPSGYLVPATQPNPVDVSVRKDRAADLNFTLHKE